MKTFFYFLIIDIGMVSWSFPTNQTLILETSKASCVDNSLLDIQNSNVSSFAPAVRIMGGVQAKPNEFPWLFHFTACNNLCSGTLIEMDLVLTAAHCLLDRKTNYKFDAGLINVTAGDHNRTNHDRTEQVQMAAWIKVHEDFDWTTMTNDIGLIKLIGNFKNTKAVQKINLPSGRHTRSSSGIVAGWGRTMVYATSRILNKVNIPILSKKLCEEQFANRSVERQFCAGGKGKNPCWGDSGGPFLCNNFANEICGIISWGDQECEQFAVYTDVWDYKPWIKENSSAFSSMLLLHNSFNVFFSILASYLVSHSFCSLV